LGQEIKRELLNSTVLNLATKAISYFSYSIIAYVWGAMLVTDIYYLGTSYVSVASGMFVIIISSVFPTVFVNIRLNNSLQEAREFAGTFIIYILLPVILISFLGSLWSVELFTFVSKINHENISNNVRTLSIFSIVILFTVLIEFCKTYLQSLNYFTFVASSYLLQAIIFLILLFSLKEIFFGDTLVISLSFSMLFQIIFLIFFALKNNILPSFSLRLTGNHKSMVAVATPLLVAHSLTLFVNYSIDFLASGYSVGVLTTIKYAQLITFLPGLLFFTPLLEVFSVRLSEIYHTGEQLLIEKFVGFQSIVILILVPVIGFIIFYRYEIVKILFFRGSFTIENVKQTSSILLIYSFTIITTSLLQIITRFYYIMQKTFWPSVYAIIFQIATLLMCVVFSKLYGFIGLPIGKVLVEILLVLPISYLLISKYLVGFSASKIFIYLIKISLINAILLYVIFFVLNKLTLIVGYSSMPQESNLFTISRLIISFVLFITCYFYLLIKLRESNAIELFGFLKRKVFLYLN
jgi:putative peptidoglycan lipid II flippase